MKQRIEPHERQRIKDLLLSGDETNYKLALQLLSVFFDKREARKFIWYECLAGLIPHGLIKNMYYCRPAFSREDWQVCYEKRKNEIISNVKKWLHSGDKSSFGSLNIFYLWGKEVESQTKLAQFIRYS